MQKIKDDERGGRAEVELIDEGEEPDGFWEALGGKGRIQTAEVSPPPLPHLTPPPHVKPYLDLNLNPKR